MKQLMLKLTILCITVAVFILIIKYTHLVNYLSIEGFNSYSRQIKVFALIHPYEFICSYIIIYVLLIVLCVPGTITFDLLAGFVFGWYYGALIAIISYSIGAFLNFLLIRYFFKGLFKNRFTKFKELLYSNGHYGLLFNLTGLRLIAVIPFWILNIVAALIEVRAITFLLSTVMGIIPSTIVYTLIGDEVKSVFASNHKLTSAALMVNSKIWIALSLLALLLILPNIIRWYKSSSTPKSINSKSN